MNKTFSKRLQKTDGYDHTTLLYRHLDSDQQVNSKVVKITMKVMFYKC